MHEVDLFLTFVKDIFKGLFEAIKTDVDVFLITVSGLLWPIKVLRGFSTALLFYVGCRRADGLMIAYQTVKQKEMSNIK
jgi:hypothetical protein